MERQKSRANQGVTDDELGEFAMTRAYLAAEWTGAIMLLLSFLLLYAFGLGPNRWSPGVLWTVCLSLLIGGTYVFWTNREKYLELETLLFRKTEILAMLVAGAAAIFWGMFAVGTFMTWRGIELF